ncbi:hydroxyisourate hydrolase [Pleomorphomonas carboxyditropha]|uniref:5-hydroxyisourate hydrolase n=1 Tax=Pleomorphomonas carboxyditropha TaxID=2023338 RepID=A0A2G9WWJ8_9HYPH|nr:hydroxyisourate hydrolase [Pleomorphomonas carboxyditropha]PIO99054.1 hydroxyisourate hydrolase [Pleomorphomonas carboxyditropha]
MAEGRLTTHVLDTATGRPAADLRIELWAVRADGGRDLLREATTNRDGRIDGALLSGAGLSAGTYELLFHAGDYLRAAGHALAEPAFLDIVPIRFGIADASAHYHVPLLISPYGYSTYRGS